MPDVLYKLFQVFVLCSLIVFSLRYLVVELIRKVHNHLKRYQGRKLLVVARQLGAWLYYNKIGKITAICRARDFRAVVKSQKDLVKPWEPPRQVMVRPTYLFCKDEYSMAQVHVATDEKGIELMIDELIEYHTGYRRSQVDKQSFEEASKVLICHNPLLFVPFAGKLTDEEGQKQLDFYGSAPPLKEVRQYLIRS